MWRLRETLEDEAANVHTVNEVPRPKPALLALLAVIVLLSGPAAGAQPELPLGYVTGNPVVISGQVRLSLQYQRQAMELLQAAERASKEDLTTIRQLVYESYVYMRFAVNGVRKAMVKSKNPMLKIREDMMEEVRPELRYCLTEVERLLKDSGSLEVAAEHLQSAINGSETVLTLMY